MLKNHHYYCYWINAGNGSVTKTSKSEMNLIIRVLHALKTNKNNTHTHTHTDFYFILSLYRCTVCASKNSCMKNMKWTITITEGLTEELA